MHDSDDEKRGARAAPVHAVIDRIEDKGVAVLLVGDDEKMQIDLPAELLPKGAKEGDHLRITIALDGAARTAAADRVKKLQEQLTQAGGAQAQKDFKL